MTSYHTSMSFQELFNHTRTVMTQYGLDYLMDGYDPELVNILLSNNFEKVRETITYDEVLNLINEGLSTHLSKWISLGGMMKVENFIKQDDCKQLYSIYTCWRGKLIDEDENLFRTKHNIQLSSGTGEEREV
jgi:hypothetical protein